MHFKFFLFTGIVFLGLYGCVSHPLPDDADAEADNSEIITHFQTNTLKHPHSNPQFLGQTATSPPVTAFTFPPVPVAGLTSAFLPFSGPAPHLDYYVAQMAVGASDTNDGLSPTKTSAHGPWVSVGKATRTAVAGDIVHVFTGTYSEQLTVTNNGTSSNPIRFYAASGCHPTIQSIRFKFNHYLELYGFTVVGPKVLPSNWVSMPAVIIDDPTVGLINPNLPWSTRSPLIWKKYHTYMNTVFNVYEGSNWSNFSAGIWASSSDHLVIAHNQVSLHTFGIACDTSSTQIRIDTNAAWHCLAGIWGSDFTYSTISHNHCFQNLSAGLSFTNQSQYLILIQNLSEYNALNQFELINGTSGCLVRHNLAQFGGYYTETLEWPGTSAFDFYNVGNGNLADANFASHQVDVTGVDGNGFIADTNGTGIGIQFSNNIAYLNSGRGVSLTSAGNNLILNNTLIGNAYGSSNTNNGGLSYNSSTKNTIYNNILLENKYQQIHGDGTLTSQTLDYNIYAPGVPALHDSYTAGYKVYNTASNIYYASGREAHGISQDPLLTPTFQLQLTSPAIKTGNFNPPPTDYLGVPRFTPADRGAIQH